MSEREICEGGCDPEAFPVVQHDSEGIPLCVNCWTELVTATLRESKEKLAAENAALREKVAFYEQCAEAPLMKTVMDERDRLQRELRAWRDRFLAIVSADQPDSAGNAVLTLQRELREAREAIRSTLDHSHDCDDVVREHYLAWCALPAVRAAVEEGKR